MRFTNFHRDQFGSLAQGNCVLAIGPHQIGVMAANYAQMAMSLVEQGRFLEAETRTLLTGAKYPARSPAKNIADLKAHGPMAVLLKVLVSTISEPAAK